MNVRLSPAARRIGCLVGACAVSAGGLLIGPATVVATVRAPVTMSSLEAAGAAEVAMAAAALPAALREAATSAGTTVDSDCYSMKYNHIDPDAEQGVPTNPAWIERDLLNVYCSTLRVRDQVASPAYASDLSQTGTALDLENLGQQWQDGLNHIHGGVTSLVPDALGDDPFRAITAWEKDTGGTVLPVSFKSLDGAVLNGNIFMPPPGTPRLADGRYPGVVITDGSVQAFQNMYYWAAEGLAQYGYMVMTYDVQGQGDSDLLPNPCTPTDCPGVPFQQSYNFDQGAEDSLNFFESTPAHPSGGSFNPAYQQLDSADVGIAGHSAGAGAVSWVSQCDRRVKAVVAWDDLVTTPISQCSKNVTIPAADRASALHAPALAMANDYEFTPHVATTVPNPNGTTGATDIATGGGGLDGDAGYLELKQAHVDSEIVSIRNGTHLIYSYIPLVLPANEIGERVAFYYTLAWLDEYLRGGKDALLPAADTAYKRLTALGTFDRSADYNDNRVDPGAADISIGAGTYSAALALSDHSTYGNVPIEIQGIPIRGALSFYYYSQYAIHDPLARHDPLRTCNDMLSGCPRKQPRTP
jgi:dienelactone hydrolase